MIFALNFDCNFEAWLDCVPRLVSSTPQFVVDTTNFPLITSRLTRADLSRQYPFSCAVRSYYRVTVASLHLRKSTTSLVPTLVLATGEASDKPHHISNISLTALSHPASSTSSRFASFACIPTSTASFPPSPSTRKEPARQPDTAPYPFGEYCSLLLLSLNSNPTHTRLEHHAGPFT